MFPQVNVGMMGGGAFAPEAKALFARMSPAPSYRRKLTINRLIRSLIRDSVWADLDVLCVTAADVAANAILNWKGTTYSPVANGPPTFTADRGFTGTGASDIATTYGQGGGVQFKQDDHTFGRWARSIGSAAHTLGAANATYEYGIKDSVGSFNVYDGDAPGGAGNAVATSSVGNIAVVRTASTGYEVFKDGASVATQTRTSQSVTEPFTVLSRNNNSVTDSFSTGQVSAFYLGKALTAAKVLALHTALQAYMTDVGA